MQEQLGAWRCKLLVLERQQAKVRKQIEGLAPGELPKGLGAYSAVALECEMKGIAHFKTSRDSSYTDVRLVILQRTRQREQMTRVTS